MNVFARLFYATATAATVNDSHNVNLARADILLVLLFFFLSLLLL